MASRNSQSGLGVSEPDGARLGAMIADAVITLDALAWSPIPVHFLKHHECEPAYNFKTKCWKTDKISVSLHLMSHIIQVGKDLDLEFQLTCEHETTSAEGIRKTSHSTCFCALKTLETFPTSTVRTPLSCTAANFSF